MKNISRLILRIFLGLILLAVLYVGVNIGYATITDFQPPPKETLEVMNPQDKTPDKQTFSFMIWNIGYAGLGAESDFFYDGGTMVRPSYDQCDKYLSGIRHIVQAAGNTDFVMLQEVDIDSRRSYHFNELRAIASRQAYHSYTYAPNYNVDWVPMPLETPWDVLGRVRAGLATYSKYKVASAERYQYPGKYPWPKRVFMLDRCFLVERVALNSGKELVVINTHNSAYDGGTLKKEEMKMLKEFVLAEYDKGNYVIVGGDWNQNPPGFDNNTFAKAGDTYDQSQVPEDYLPEGWQFVYDPKTPTNRKLAKAYDPDKTFTTIIDFYLLSPNIEPLKVHTGDLGFQFSDHQPVYLDVQLK